MQRHRIMEAGFDSRSPHIVAQPIAVLAAEHVEVEHMVVVHDLRYGERQAGKPLVIGLSELAPTVRPAFGLGVVTQVTQALCDDPISGDHESRLASGAEILCRIEAVATAQAERTNATPVETCADSLRRILDYNQPMPRSKCHDARHVSRLSIKMDGNDRLHCSIKPPFGVGKVDICALLLYVAEDGRCSHIKHPPGRGDKSMGRDQHLIPWPMPAGNQGKMQSTRTGVDPDRV